MQRTVIRVTEVACALLLLGVGAQPLAAAELPKAGRHAAAPTARVIVLGDSISEGVGATASHLAYAPLLLRNDDALYPHARGDDLQTLLGPEVQFLNLARAGDTTDMLVHEQLPRLAARSGAGPAALAPGPLAGHTLVVLTIGGNDIRLQLGPAGEPVGSTLQHAMANLRQVMAFFADRTRFVDGVTVYFGTVYDMTDGTDAADVCIEGLRFAGISEALRVWEQAYVALEQEVNCTPATTVHAAVVDLRRLFLGHGFQYANERSACYNAHDPTLWLSEQDCIHPNNRGHHELRNAFFRAIYAGEAQRSGVDLAKDMASR